MTRKASFCFLKISKNIDESEPDPERKSQKSDPVQNHSGLATIKYITIKTAKERIVKRPFFFTIVRKSNQNHC